MARVYALVFAALGWFTLVGHYLNRPALHSLGGLLDYLSYFTILSNTLVAAIFTAAALAPASRAGRFLLSPPVAMAAAVYITITALVFHFLLSHLYDLHGWTATYDHLLHYVLPPAYVLFWLLFVPKGRLRLSSVPWMMLPPLVFAGWTLVHGAASGFYPYPFVDVTKLGYGGVLVRIAGFVVFFALMGLLYVGLDRLIARLGPRAVAPRRA